MVRVVTVNEGGLSRVEARLLHRDRCGMMVFLVQEGVDQEAFEGE